MKEIKVVVQPFKANQVLEALHCIDGVSGVMSSDVRCTSAARGTVDPDVNVKIELYVADEVVSEVLSAIMVNAHTGNAGDGRIFITDVQETVSIRTGDHNVS